MAAVRGLCEESASHGGLPVVLESIGYMAAGVASIAYFAIAGVVAHSAAKDEFQARQWLYGLFIAVYALLLALGWRYVA